MYYSIMCVEDKQAQIIERNIHSMVLRASILRTINVDDAYTCVRYIEALPRHYCYSTIREWELCASRILLRADNKSHAYARPSGNSRDGTSSMTDELRPYTYLWRH